MKNKPDTMTTMVLLFLLGVVVTGFSSFTVGSADQVREKAEIQVSLSE